jgi:hypothetical protein
MIRFSVPPRTASREARVLADWLRQQGKSGPVAGSALQRGGRTGLFLAWNLQEPWLGDDPTASPASFLGRGVRFVVLARSDPRIDALAKLRQCIANGTSGEADDWYDQIRARIQESRENQLLTSLRGVEVIFENAQEGLANVQITLRSIPTSARAKAQESEYPLILAWKLDEKQGWLLDGTRTLEGMKLGNRP